MQNGGLSFTLPMLPPSVNHYIEHPARGVHKKSAAAKAWEQDFQAMLPAAVRGQYVTGNRFWVTLCFTPGPKDRGDVDNRNKLVLDCCAAAGMFRNLKGEQLSDAWVKRLYVDVDDLPGSRARGPKTEVVILPL
jgi:Holliday junction resolvase RusA-like endonuclease